MLAALFLAACRRESTEPATGLEATDPEKTIEVSAGSEFTIRLRTDLPSDYHWEIAEFLDPEIVEFVRKDHLPDNPDSSSSSGWDAWRFKAVGPGKATITFGYYFGMTLNATRMQVITVVVK